MPWVQRTRRAQQAATKHLENIMSEYAVLNMAVKAMREAWLDPEACGFDSRAIAQAIADAQKRMREIVAGVGSDRS